MTSQFDEDFAVSGADDLLAQFGETVEQWPGGGAHEPASITGIFSETEPLFRSDDSGQAVQREAKLRVSGEIAVVTADREQACDVFVVRGKRWRAMSANLSQAGLVEIMLLAADVATTKRSRVT